MALTSERGAGAWADELRSVQSSLDEAIQTMEQLLEQAPAEPRVSLGVAIVFEQIEHVCALLASLDEAEAAW